MSPRLLDEGETALACESLHWKPAGGAEVAPAGGAEVAPAGGAEVDPAGLEEVLRLLSGAFGGGKVDDGAGASERATVGAG